MKHIFTIIIIALFVIPINAQEENSTSTTYYFIRHAEKDKSDVSNKNPHLNMNGILRAAKWTLVFENIQFDAVYSTNYHRTIETAQPTAEKNKVDITIYDPRNLDLENFLANTKGKRVLVVGHSNSTPTFVNSILGKEKYTQIDESNNANLYIVTISSTGDISDSLIVIK